MRTKLSYKIIAMFMASLMFFSSVGISMDTHFCGGEFQSFSFFGDAEVCEIMKAKQEKKINRSCCESTKETKNYLNKDIAKSNCCHNKTLVMDNGGEFETSTYSLEQLQQVLLVAIILTPNFNLFETSSKQVNYVHYNPPPIIKDISILLQVFRI